MKKIFILIAVVFSLGVQAQEFDKNLASARTAYAAGNLEDTRFALQQMLNDIDLLVGKEMLKLLPQKMNALASNPKEDNVTINSGVAGVLVQRSYGTDEKNALIDIMGNSPLVGSLNAILSLPMMGNSGDGTQKTVKVQGYKGVLQKNENSNTGKTDFTLQIPLNSTLLTFTVNDSNEANVLRMAETIPVTAIAKLVQ